MATAFHLEALRKQRVLDRAYEASRKLQSSETFAEAGSSEPQDFPQQQGHGGHEHQDGTRPPSRTSRSRPQSAQGRASTSPPHLTANEGAASSLGTNKPAESDQTGEESKVSRPSSARSYSDSTHRPSFDSVADAPGASRQATSRPSSSARSSRAESRIAAVRRDLKKQESILHNSNLVMGPLSVEQELSDRATPHKILS